MAYNFKETCKKPERMTGGHRMCAGCGAPPVVRTILRALKPEDHAVVGAATGCLEVCTFLYPYTSWKDSFIHSAFENSAATVSGAEACYRAMKKKGTLPSDKEIKYLAFGGDGGTYDIGIQSLSGAMERNHNMVYICYDNGAYMNTGVQRSSATPKFASTTTSPAGKVLDGKSQPKKDLTLIMASHNLPYVAQTAPFGNFRDLYEKAEKAIYTEGACFLNVLAPCPRGWIYDTPLLFDIIKLALDTCMWPIYEIENGALSISYRPKNKLPIEDFLKPQGRFRHLFKKGNEHLIAQIQKEVDDTWEKLQKMAVN